METTMSRIAVLALLSATASCDLAPPEGSAQAEAVDYCSEQHPGYWVLMWKNLLLVSRNVLGYAGPKAGHTPHRVIEFHRVDSSNNIVQTIMEFHVAWRKGQQIQTPQGVALTYCADIWESINGQSLTACTSGKSLEESQKNIKDLIHDKITNQVDWTLWIDPTNGWLGGPEDEISSRALILMQLQDGAPCGRF